MHLISKRIGNSAGSAILTPAVLACRTKQHVWKKGKWSQVMHST